MRQFIQDQVMNQQIKPKTIQRFCLKESYLDMDFMSGIESPKTDEKLPVYMSLRELMS